MSDMMSGFRVSAQTCDPYKVSPQLPCPSILRTA
jgi:hypothetical protein